MADHRPTSYDSVPYGNVAFRETHPRRLATVGAVFGLETAEVETCRVLELGCASGGNLLPMVHSLPRARFVGIDLSRRQIDEGEALRAELALDNVELRQMNIMDVDTSVGRFDYIICHGVFSWVPHEVQEKILRICRDQLAENGVALVSFNAYPGSYARQAIRDMMLFHTRGMPDAAMQAREARRVLQVVDGSPLSMSTTAAIAMRSQNTLLAGKPDNYLMHEYLEEHNYPIYFWEFMERAARHGLQYLGDAHTNGTTMEESDPQFAQLLAEAGGDIVRIQQYCDFVHNASFRRTLLCHDQANLDHRGSTAVVHRLAAAAALHPAPQIGRGRRFAYPGGGFVPTGVPLVQAALCHLGDIFPQTQSFEDLCRRVRPAGLSEPEFQSQCDSLAQELLEDWKLALVELDVTAPVLVLTAGEKPEVSSLARHLARRQDQVPNLRHEIVKLDEGCRGAVGFMEGTRTRQQIAEEMVSQGGGSHGASTAGVKAQESADEILSQGGGESAGDAHVRRQEVLASLDKMLVQLGRQALLVR